MTFMIFIFSLKIFKVVIFFFFNSSQALFSGYFALSSCMLTAISCFYCEKIRILYFSLSLTHFILQVFTHDLIMVFLLSECCLAFLHALITFRTTNLKCMKIHKHFQQQPHPIATVRNKHYIKIDS